MVKTTKNRTYDTATASVVKKVTHGQFGDPVGYENTLYRTPEGDYFLYTNGGEASAFTTEKITPVSRANAKRWLEEN